MNTRGVGLLLFLVALAGLDTAASARPLDKSILVTWIEDRVVHFIGATRENYLHSIHSVVIYISRTGRVFHRYSARLGSNTGASEQVQSEQGRKASFEGSTLLIQNAFPGGGGRRVAVTFGAGDTTCTATVTNGLAAGETKSVRKSVIDGRTYELLSSKSSGERCEIQSGNVFAE